MSVVPPAAAGTTRVTGRVGYSSAAAPRGAELKHARDVATARAVPSRRRRKRFILNLSDSGLVLMAVSELGQTR